MSCENPNEIFLDESELSNLWTRVPRKPSSIDGHIKHVHLEDARCTCFIMVIFWSSL